jgi:probable F420-dependent oxidoreductase
MVSGQHPEGMPDGAELSAIARLAEDRNFDSIWVGDHISFHNPILEGMTAVTALALWTAKIRVGTGILLVPLRHPSLVAKQAASVDHLADGRLIMGVGVGGEGTQDFAAVEISPRERGARTDESMQAMAALWSGHPASFHGRHFNFADVVIQPPPRQAGGPPMWVGGGSAATFDRIGRLGHGWLAYMISTDKYAAGVAEIADAAEAAGRDPADITPALMLPTVIDNDGGRARATLTAHLEERYQRPYPPHVIERYCAAGTPDEVRDRIAEYADAGLRHCALLPGGPSEDRLAEVARFATELIDYPTH